MDLFALLKTVVDEDGSDLFLSAGAKPHARFHGVTRPISEHTLAGNDVRGMVYTLMSKRQMEQFESSLECNLGVNVGALGRFRVNVFMQRGEPAAVLRYIPSVIPSLAQLGLPRELEALAMQRHGLVLVVGPPGCGKSTTLAAMIAHRNLCEAGHILTIEDPIEYVHLHQKCVVDQREVGVDTFSLQEALRNALREEPDVIMLAEIRDRETMQHAINYAETGHLCLSTVHATDARKTIARIVSFYPEDARPQISMDLALNLRAIVSQRMVQAGAERPRIDAELLVNSTEVSELLRKGLFEQIHAGAPS